MSDWPESSTRWFAPPDMPIVLRERTLGYRDWREGQTVFWLFEWIGELLLFLREPSSREALRAKWLLHWGVTITW